MVGRIISARGSDRMMSEDPPEMAPICMKNPPTWAMLQLTNLTVPPSASSVNSLRYERNAW